jgi:hypothetical protein
MCLFSGTVSMLFGMGNALFVFYLKGVIGS